MSYSTDRRFLGADPWAQERQDTPALAAPNTTGFSSLIQGVINAGQGIGSLFGNAAIGTAGAIPTATPPPSNYIPTRRPSVMPVALVAGLVIGAVLYLSKKANS